MPVYAHPGQGSNGMAYFQNSPGSGAQAGLIGARQRAISAATTVNSPGLYHNTASVVSSGISAEKLNTRSPASNSAEWFAGVNGPLTFPIVTLSQSLFNNSWFTVHPRYPILCNEDIDLIIFFLTTGSGQVNTVQLTVDTDVRGNSWSRGTLGRKRTRKPGYRNIGGNCIARVATSGGGSFSAIYPQFQNDLTWVDPSAWRNGMHQSDVWNINLFGPAPTVNCDLSVTLGALTLASAVAVTVQGAASNTLGVLTSTSAGSVLVQAAASNTLGVLTASSAGTVSVTGSSSITLGVLTTTCDGSVLVQCASSNTLGSCSSASAGSVLVQGAASNTLGVLTVTATGSAAVTADASITLGTLTAASDGSVFVRGDAAITLGTLTSASTGTVSITGDASILLGDLTLASDGSVLVQADLNVTLGELTLVASDSETVTCDADITLGACSLSADASVLVLCDLNQTLGDLTCASDGTVGTSERWNWGMHANVQAGGQCQ
jgi:hypothetical protein